ncbi:MAG: ABC transporter ATP-binding protein/permease [Clostridiales bacterium]|nr:ABC transporter ATP-binding protein/permease [Clostridiales bacterium]
MIKKRLVDLLSHAKKYIVFQVLWQWIALLTQVILVYCAAILLEGALFTGIAGRTAATYGVVMACAIALRFVCDRQASYASLQASIDVKRILRDKIYRKLLRLGASYRESVATSEVVQMAAEGVEQLETYFGRYLPQFFYSMLAPLTLFVILSFVSIKASVVLLICVPLIPLSIVAVQKIAKRLLSKYWGMYTQLGDSFLENLQGLTTLKIYRADGQKAEEMDAESQRFRQITMKVLTMQLNSTSVMDIVAYGGAAVGMVVALLQFSKGNITFSGTVMIILLAAEFFLPLRLLGSFFHIAMNGMAASDKIFELLDLPEPEARDGEIPDGQADVCLSEVIFSYGGQTPENFSKLTIDHVSMDFPAGSFTSIVGTSGCGKSTVAGILMGRNRGYGGNITVGGAELSGLSEECLMEHITLVSHNAYLFKGTVEDNLRMGKPDASEEELIAALMEVNLWGFLKGQKGLDTRLTEQASNLSGGQRQRLAIARALLHDTPIYIFDEATSNIDAESEEMIMEVIRGLAFKKTVVLISHRLANVVQSDCIYMMEDGKVVESGSHAALMAAGGAYSRLYRSQRELEAWAEDGNRVSAAQDNGSERFPAGGNANCPEGKGGLS